MGQDTSEGNSGTNEGVEFFVSTYRKLQMTRGNTLDLEILCGVL